MNYLVIYPGRFHPFHRGHRASYEYLAKKYGADHVYIATTGVQAPVTSPFTFADKVQMISTLGIPSGHVVKVSNPYQSREITDSIPSEEKANTVLIFALSAKDAERFNFAPKKDGTASYLQPMPENLKKLKPMTAHAYVEIVPTVNFKVRGKDANSASQIREFYIKGNNNDRDQIIAELYGEAYPELRDIFDDRLGVSEQVQKIVREAKLLNTTKSIALIERILTKERHALNEFVIEDWQKVNQHDKTDGMSKKAVSAYRREHPGSKLKTAVTTKPGKLKKGSADANRRKSFCARMSGMKKHNASAKTKHDPDSPINKALRRWNCESIEELQELAMIAEQKLLAFKQGIVEGKHASNPNHIYDILQYAINDAKLTGKKVVRSEGGYYKLAPMEDPRPELVPNKNRAEEQAKIQSTVTQLEQIRDMHPLDAKQSRLIKQAVGVGGKQGYLIICKKIAQLKRDIQDVPYAVEKEQGISESESPADTLYFFDVGRGGRSFTNVDLRAMGLQQSQSGKWYYRPGGDSTPLLLKTTLDHLAKQLNVPPKPWQRPQTNEGIRDVLNFGIKKPTVKPAAPVDDFTAKIIANKQKNLKILHPKEVYKSPEEYTKATGNKIKESTDYLEEK